MTHVIYTRVIFIGYVRFTTCQLNELAKENHFLYLRIYDTQVTGQPRVNKAGNVIESKRKLVPVERLRGRTRWVEVVHITALGIGMKA